VVVLEVFPVSHTKGEKANDKKHRGRFRRQVFTAIRRVPEQNWNRAVKKKKRGLGSLGRAQGKIPANLRLGGKT